MGKAIVDILDTKKVTVIVLDRTLPVSSASQYNDVSFYECDVSQYSSVTNIAEQIRQEVIPQGLRLYDMVTQFQL